MSVARFIASQRTDFGVPHTIACRALEVSPSWLYKWLGRTPAPGRLRRAELVERIRKSFVDSGGTYGSTRVVLDLREQGRAGVGEHGRENYAHRVSGRQAPQTPARLDQAG